MPVRRGDKLFRCADCKHAWMERPKRLTHAARLRCTACGSIAVDISAQGGKAIVKASDASRDAATTGHYAIYSRGIDRP
jgi:hypothetical protein